MPYNMTLNNEFNKLYNEKFFIHFHTQHAKNINSIVIKHNN